MLLESIKCSLYKLCGQITTMAMGSGAAGCFLLNQDMLVFSEKNFPREVLISYRVGQSGSLFKGIESKNLRFLAGAKCVSSSNHFL